MELAAGTGKWTEQLIKAGCEVTAVEPSAEMRNILFKRAPAAALVDAVAEELPFPSEYYDFVFAATAFHWFDAYKTYGEISRVLKPGGGVGLVWTSRDPGMEPQWYSDLRTLIKPFEGGTPRYSHMEWRTPFDREIDFRMLQFERHDISRPRTTVEIVERLLSISYISALPDLLFFALKRELEDILASYILGGQVFKMPEEIHLYWTHKES